MKRTRAETEQSHGRLTRRAALLGGAQLLFMGGLAARMRFLQVEQADQYRLLAEENRINVRLIPPSRGEVFDRNGRRLAQNAPSFFEILSRDFSRAFWTSAPARVSSWKVTADQD